MSFLDFYIPIRWIFLFIRLLLLLHVYHTRGHARLSIDKSLPAQYFCNSSQVNIPSYLKKTFIMATFISSSSSSSSARMIFSGRLLYILFLAFLLFGSSFATRPGRTMVESNKGPASMKSSEILKAYQEKYKMHKDMVFNSLPKGTPIPPSGPSKRHNLEISSSTLNWEVCNSLNYTHNLDILIFQFVVLYLLNCFFSPCIFIMREIESWY